MLLLLGTAMPALVRMTCLSGGHTVLSIGQAEDCCPEEPSTPEGAQLEAICCEFERTAPSRTDFHVESGPTLVAVAHLIAVSSVEMIVPVHDPAIRYAFTSRPPPLLTAERLSQVGSLLI